MRAWLLVLPLAACGRSYGPEESVEQAVADALSVFEEHDVDVEEISLVRTHFEDSRWRELRRDLRDAVESWVELPDGTFWGHPAVDYGTSVAAEILVWIARSDWRVVTDEIDPERNPRKTRGRLRYEDARGARSLELVLEKTGRRWVITGEFERPR